MSDWKKLDVVEPEIFVFTEQALIECGVHGKIGEPAPFVVFVSGKNDDDGLAISVGDIHRVGEIIKIIDPISVAIKCGRRESELRTAILQVIAFDGTLQ